MTDTTPRVDPDLVRALRADLVASGFTVAGVTDDEAAEATELPATLVAWTVKVYAVPLLRPVTVQGLLVQTLVMPSGAEVTV